MINASPINMINAYTYGFILYWSIQPRGQIPDTPPCRRGAIIHTRGVNAKLIISPLVLGQKC